MTFKRWIKKTYFGNLPESMRAFPYFGTRVYFPRNSFVFQIACEHGIYEWENVKLLQALVEPDSLVFDVGANIGLMAVPLLAGDRTIRVRSLEPSPNSLPYLQRTAQGSSFGDRWNVVGKAVGNKSGTVEFCIANAEMGAFDGMRDTGRTGSNGKVQVPMTTIDEEWEALGSPRVSVIKIDVEGAERMAMEGGARCIARHRPALMVEWNASNLAAFECDPGWILEFARLHHYSLLCVPSLAPVTTENALKAHMALSESFCLLADPAVAAPSVC